VTLDLAGAADHEEVLRRVMWSIPTMLGVLGTVDASGDAHLMNISWVTPVASNPVRLAAAVETQSHSQANLTAVPKYTLSLLSLDQRALGRAFVKPDLDRDVVEGVELIAGYPVVRASAGTAYLADAHAVLAGSAQLLRDLGDHVLWLFEVESVAAHVDVLDGPASDHSRRALGVFDTRMNYGR